MSGTKTGEFKFADETGIKTAIANALKGTYTGPITGKNGLPLLGGDWNPWGAEVDMETGMYVDSAELRRDSTRRHTDEGDFSALQLRKAMIPYGRPTNGSGHDPNPGFTPAVIRRRNGDQKRIAL